MNKPNPDLDALKKDPQAARLLNDPAALKSLLSSPETQKLMALLNQSAGGSLQGAAQAAAKGRPEALIGILNQVMQSREGASAVENLKKKAEK
ncbi:MAG: hypothetical protein PUC36_00995 [Clostridiales bacterium]|nr:hypothetical protein [Clostridiales bacterium]